MRGGSIRRGFLARCEIEGGEGWGDIAPLDGYSRETFDEVAREINRAESSSLASIRCGLDFAREACRTPPRKKTRVEIASLWDSDEQRTPASGTVKLKVGRNRLSNDVERVKRIMADNPQARFRLDANRAWGLDDALTFCRALDPARVEFVEEPLRDFSDYDAYNQASPVGFALDESLIEQSPRPWERLRALVVKPSLQGGLEKSLSLIDWAYQAGKYAVVSAMYESGVGIRHLAALASAKTPGVPAGLDTYARLLEDVASPRIDMQAGGMTTGDPYTIDMSKLELVR